MILNPLLIYILIKNILFLNSYLHSIRTSDKIGVNQKEEWNNLKQEIKDGKIV